MPTFFIGEGLYIRVRKLIMVGVVLVVVVMVVVVMVVGVVVVVIIHCRFPFHKKDVPERQVDCHCKNQGQKRQCVS